MGVQFDNVTMQQALEMAQTLLERPGADYCVTPNAEIVYEAMHDAAFAQLINGAALVLPDGAGVVKAARILGTPLQQKVAGIDFAAALLDVLARPGQAAVFCWAASPAWRSRRRAKLREALPAACRSAVRQTAILSRKRKTPSWKSINAAAADVLFVCLGAPKQERFMQRHQAQLQVSFDDRPGRQRWMALPGMSAGRRPG